METMENSQIEAILESLLEQDLQAKRHKVVICDIQQESLKETPPKLPRGNSKKSLQNHQKGKTGGTQRSLEEPRRIIYTYQERFIQGLASAQPSFPLTRSHHDDLKLVLEILRKIGRENRKPNELGFQEMAAILSPLRLYGGKPKD
jgi:hypothetical protein